MNNINIPILYQDDCLVIVNKPAGLPVHQTVDPLRPHLLALIQKQLNLDKAPILFHRLDVDTTGVLVMGIDDSINRYMTDLFRERRVKKLYQCVVDGRWPEHVTEVKTFIKKIAGGKYRNFNKGSTKEFAHTKFKVLKCDGGQTLLECELITGKTHQIRLHCQSFQHPILGDKIYGSEATHTIALHSQSIEFKHPKTSTTVFQSAELPKHW